MPNLLMEMKNKELFLCFFFPNAMIVRKNTADAQSIKFSLNNLRFSVARVMVQLIYYVIFFIINSQTFIG